VSLCDYDIERTFRTEKYLSKLEAQRERERERLRVAKELEHREVVRLAKYKELLEAEADARAKRQAEREVELLRASKVRQEIRELKHQRRLIEAETLSLSAECHLSVPSMITCRPRVVSHCVSYCVFYFPPSLNDFSPSKNN